LNEVLIRYWSAQVDLIEQPPWMILPAVPAAHENPWQRVAA